METDSNIADAIRGWERLRVSFNVALFFPGVLVLFLWSFVIEGPIVLFHCALFALTANAYYSLAPLAEAYVTDCWRPVSEWRIFGFLAVTGGALLVEAFFGWVAREAMIAQFGTR